VLFADNSFSVLIPTIFLFVYALFVRLFIPFVSGGEFNQGDVILALLTSGTLFVAVFMIQWFGTHPMTVVGKVIYAIFAGLYAFILIGGGTSPVGMVYLIVVCNIINLLIRLIEEKRMDMLMHKMTRINPIDQELLNAGNKQ
jgi:electron transport complex protein RnfD